MPMLLQTPPTARQEEDRGPTQACKPIAAAVIVHHCLQYCTTTSNSYEICIGAGPGWWLLFLLILPCKKSDVMEHALTVLACSAAVGSVGVYAIQQYSHKAWVEWWDREDDSDVDSEDEVPPLSQHAETLAKREHDGSGDHAQHRRKHQRELMTEEQLNRSSDIGRLLMGGASDDEIGRKIASLRKRAEADIKSGRHAQAMRLRTVLDIAVYVLIFAAICYLLSTEYNFNLSSAAKSMAPTESGALAGMGERFILLRSKWQQHVVPLFK